MWTETKHYGPTLEQIREQRRYEIAKMSDSPVDFLIGLASGYWFGFIMHSRSVERAIKGALKALMERSDGE